jgi:hypothetical protein
VQIIVETDGMFPKYVNVFECPSVQHVCAHDAFLNEVTSLDPFVRGYVSVDAVFGMCRSTSDSCTRLCLNESVLRTT